jgi:hypothetical protein
VQERIFFRNIPLSNWIEREMLIEDGLETRQLPAESLFTPPALPTVETPLAITKLLQEVKASPAKPVPPAVTPQVIEPVLLTQHATAFGAQ